LKETAAANKGALTIGFEPSKVSSIYGRIKALNKQKGVKFSPKNLEYFLFVFKQLKMYPEIIDACEHFKALTGSGASSEISQYYLSSALLDLPAKGHYINVVKNAVFHGNNEGSAGYITALTKAHLKDGAVEHSFKFFEAEVGKLRELKTKREDVLVSMFDSVYGEAGTLSYDGFRDNYIQTMHVSENLLRESQAVSLLNNII
jgi:hypothetical protein